MFRNRMTVTIKEAKETRRKRKKGEDEKGDLLMLLALEMPIKISLAKDLGAGAVALLKSREANEPKVLPFRKAALPDDYEGLRLSVFDGNGTKFEVDGCTAKKLYLARDKNTPANALFGCTLKVPPMAQTHMNYLINAVGTELEIALVQPQQEMDV